MFDLRGLIFDVKKSSRPRCAPRTSTIKHPPSNIHGLTLIELLVVIVILTTLVAGVIPVLSPNNDTRRIREATRGLQTYIVMAQAEAARTGRDQGIAFLETSAGSGVALEVFRLEIPAPFAGFSEDSRCTIASSIGTYGSGGNGGTRFQSQYDGWDLYGITFKSAGVGGAIDEFPPRMFRLGDQVNVGGNMFLIVDDDNDSMAPNLLAPYPPSSPPAEQVLYLELPFAGPNQQIQCVWINSTGQLPPQGEKSYKIIRQPTNSAEAPHQLPASIAIDMQGSVAEGSNTGGFPMDASLFTENVGTPPFQPDTVGIMFSPTGSVSSVLLNGTSLTNVSRLVLLLGRVENGGLPDLSPNPGPWAMSENDTNEQIEEKQETINWLNLDSRWLSIAASSGRVVVTENAFVSPRQIYDDGDDPASAEDQIEAAHAFAHEMKSTGAGR